MNIKELIEQVELKMLTNHENQDIDGVFVSDMMSDVMTHAQAGDLWITVQTHKNVISTANLMDVSAVVITHGKTVPDETIELASKFQVTLLHTNMNTYSLIAKLIEGGLTPR